MVLSVKRWLTVLCLKVPVCLAIEMHILLQVDASIFSLHVSISMSLASKLCPRQNPVFYAAKIKWYSFDTEALIWAALHPAGTCPLFEAFVRGLCEFRPTGSPCYIT